MSKKRDHEAMAKLRFHSLKRGWLWRWHGIDLLQVAAKPGDRDYYKAPADAVLAERKEADDA